MFRITQKREEKHVKRKTVGFQPHGHRARGAAAAEPGRADDAVDAGAGAVQRGGQHLCVLGVGKLPVGAVAGLPGAEYHDRTRHRHRRRRQHAGRARPGPRRPRGCGPRRWKRRDALAVLLGADGRIRPVRRQALYLLPDRRRRDPRLRRQLSADRHDLLGLSVSRDLR